MGRSRPVAELPDRVLFLLVSGPPLWTPPPHPLLFMPPVAELPDRVQLLTVSVPRLSIPPPVSLTCPLVMVRPSSSARTPASIWNTRLALAPLTGMRPPPTIGTGGEPLAADSSNW